MIRIFKLVLKRRESGYTISHDVIYFSDKGSHEQCDHLGQPVQDPIFVLDAKWKKITEITNPDELGLAKHESHIYSDEVQTLQLTWSLAKNEKPQTVFTTLPHPIFTELFHEETRQ